MHFLLFVLLANSSMPHIKDPSFCRLLFFCTKAEITKLIALFLLVPISALGKVRLVRLSCSCVHQR